MVTAPPKVLRIDRMFRALSDPTRLRILQLLRSVKDFDDGRGARDGEVCVCDLTRVIESPQPTISRHLAYLRRCGLVKQRKQGLWNYYRLAPTRSRLHAKLLECLDACRTDMPEFVEDGKNLRCRCGPACCM